MKTVANRFHNSLIVAGRYPDERPCPSPDKSATRTNTWLVLRHDIAEWRFSVHTYEMLRLTWCCVLASLMLPSATVAQVRIQIPQQHYKIREEIRTKVSNTANYPVTVCLGFLPDSIVSPFEIQQYGNGKWGILLLGIDIGGGSVRTVLKPGQSYDFPFHLNDPGRMRLRLEYWRGSLPNLNCNDLPKGSKLTTSKTFTVE